MKKLYMIGLGGSIKNANVEVHSMQFAIADRIEDCFEEMKTRWYGDSLHLDSYIEMNYIDGYKIDLNSDTDKELYMIVFGGYKKGVIDELHDYTYLLANTKAEAKKKAKTMFAQFPNMNHVDEVVNVFENVGQRFGFIEGDYSFKDNEIVHTFKILK